VKVGLTANPSKPLAVELASRVAERVGDRAEVVLSDELAAVAPDRPHLPLASMRPDVVVAIGGDGTFLYALRRVNAPLLPVNAGTVGVLAEVDASHVDAFDAAIDRLLDGHYYLEERMKLAAQVDGRPVPDAVNEFVLHSARVGKMGRFDIAFDGHLVGRVQADGVIVASPTGSTGYSLSSLGPIVDPGLDAIVVTTIAPFRVRLRPADSGPAAVVIADGQAEHPLAPHGSVTIYRSPRRAVLVRFGSRFFQRLRGKRILPWSEEFADEEPHGAHLPPAP
jgi:NAD+ kinase